MKVIVKLVALAVLVVPFVVVPLGVVQAAEQPAQPAAKYQAKSAKLTRVQIDKLLASPEQLLFIDLRRPDELTNIGGFPVYLSIQLADLEKSLAFIPKDRTIVTVSNHAGRALRGADLLAEKGFNVAGAAGVQDYEEEGGWLRKVTPPAQRELTNFFPNN
ncbi:rhodanese-like domain-containing protein [Cellvibrio sp. KY-GH-1]|uniref:rhodanese-like domain-containing protein n=1 Tax=Cellvibrio sp. KY-GH-1 TaxID=2303332 RepID=UPI0012447A84|nr:rhodanese-like domain-containing protein [Cellvibrio sp. KY-GH-1]QEY14595.1 rhodanese-like domain-containing protein [Cellvibrio sp. KY-GH-1]